MVCLIFNIGPHFSKDILEHELLSLKIIYEIHKWNVNGQIEGLRRGSG
jgi:hypothetical protein